MKYFCGKFIECFTIKQCVLTAILLVSAAVSVTLTAFSVQGERRVFIFSDVATGDLVFETRYLPRTYAGDQSSELSFYVDELILGPLTPGFRPLFAPHTGVLSAFARDGAAWINLDGGALMPGGGSPPALEACSILEKNVFTNFRDIDTIYLYILNREVYSDISMPAFK